MKIGTRKGNKVVYGGKEMRVVGARDMHTLIVVSAQGEYFDAAIRDLEAEAVGGPSPRVSIDPQRAAKVDAYYAALGPLLGNGRNTKAAVAEAADKLGISVSSAYAAIARFRQSGRTDLLPPPTRPGGRGKSRLLPAIEKIIQETLEATVLKRGGAKPRKFYREVNRRLRKTGYQVSQATLASRVANIPEYRWTKARKGYNETSKTHDPIIDHYPTVHRPLEAVQIDHWMADIEVMSDDRLHVIGRVWITVAIDIFSRMIFGLHVGFDAPSTSTFGMAMINGMLRKDAIAQKYGLEWDNPICGKPERLEADNAGEFTGKSAIASCAHFNIRMQWRPLGKPQYGAHIERLNGNLASRFRDLPGATGASAGDRKSLRPEATAAFTLEDLTKHVWLIVNEYHNAVHTGIGKTPLEKFKGYYFGPNGQEHRLPDVFVDTLQFRLHWFPLKTRTIQRYGIRIDYLDYYSPSLQWLVKHRKNYKEIEVRRHPFDVRVIYVKHPDRAAEYQGTLMEEEWIPVSVRQLNFPVASIYELRDAKKEALRRKRRPIPEELAKIIEEQHLHIEEAIKKTKGAQRKAAQKSHHDRIRSEKPATTPTDHRVITVAAVPAPKPPPASTYDVEKRVGKGPPAHTTDSIAAILQNVSEDDVEAMFE